MQKKPTVMTSIAGKNAGAVQGSQPSGQPRAKVPAYAPVDIAELYERALPYLVIDVNDVRNEMVRHTANYAYLTQELARAKGKVADYKTNLEYQKGLRFITCKQASWTDVNGKSVAFTDTMAKSYVDIDEDVLEARQMLADAERELAFWQTILDAMYQRSYMLTKLAEMQEHELLLAGNEYNAGIKQQIKNELSDDDYMRATEPARKAAQSVQAQRLQDAMKMNRTASQGVDN